MSVEPVPAVPGVPTAAAAGPPTRFLAAAIGASGVVFLAAVVVMLGRPSGLDELVPVLAAGGLLCLALLVRHRVPGLAWGSLVGASLAAAGVPIAISRTIDPSDVGVEAWLVIAARSSLAAIVTLGIAAMYATRPERRPGRGVKTLAALLVAWLAIGCVVIVVVTLGGAEADPGLTWRDVATRPTALFVDAVLLLAAVGVAGDVRAAAARADARLAEAGRFAGGPGRPAEAARPAFGDRVRATLRELIPGEADAATAALEAERSRLAGDLHAVVLPTLRRAIAEVEAGGPVEVLAERLRSVDAELERLMADRWPVVLETFGLVQAFEELAERIEGDAGMRVELDVGMVEGRPPAEVERAAWRIAGLALDNAVRHAAAETVTIEISVTVDRLRLAILDDGRGIDAGRAAEIGRRAGRGLLDLERRAVAVGGALAVEPRTHQGTAVTFDWPARS